MRSQERVEPDVVGHITNALVQCVAVPWEECRRYGDVLREKSFFITIVERFLKTRVDLETLSDDQLEMILRDIFASEGFFWIALLTPSPLSEQGVDFFQSARVFFEGEFLGYSPDRRLWLQEAAMMIMFMIAQAFPCSHLDPGIA